MLYNESGHIWMLTRLQLRKWASSQDRSSEVLLLSTQSGVGVRCISYCVVFLSSEADGDPNAGFYMNLPIGGVAAVLIAFVPIQ